MLSTFSETKKMIYVGNLPRDTTENEVHRLFSIYGRISKINFSQEKIKENNKIVKPFAIIVYEDEKSAGIAIKNLNNSKLHNQEIRVMFYEPDNKGKGKNIWVKNLPPVCNNELLTQCFSVFGAISSAKVAMDDNNKSKGYGFIHFKDKKSAKKAMKMKNLLNMEGNTLTIEYYQSPEERRDPEKKPFTNLFFKDFPIEKIDEVKEKLNGFGPVTSLYVPTFIKNGIITVKGTGFVNFQNHEDALKAVEELHGSNIFCKRVKFYIKRALSKEERKEEVLEKFSELQLPPEKFKKNIHVRNINSETSDEELIKLFGEFGEILSNRISLPKPPKADYKTAQFLYETPEIAQQVIEKMDGFELNGNKLEVIYYKGARERTKEILLQKTLNFVEPKEEFIRRFPHKTKSEVFNLVKSLSEEMKDEWHEIGYATSDDFADDVSDEIIKIHSPEEINELMSIGDSLQTAVISILKKRLEGKDGQ